MGQALVSSPSRQIGLKAGRKATPKPRSDQPSRGETRATAGHQSEVERILDLSRHLQPTETALIHAVYQRGMSARALATAADVSARTLQRRVKRLLDRMASARFRFVLAPHPGWSVERMAVARAIILEGRTQRDAATALDISTHAVRAHLLAITTEFDLAAQPG